jgi:coproporphyrinogen III oxidase
LFFGTDLFEEDACDFHAFYKALCDRHDSSLYPEYKALCDKYFYIPARKEHRGLGGIFFDDLSHISGNGIPAEGNGISAEGGGSPEKKNGYPEKTDKDGSTGGGISQPRIDHPSTDELNSRNPENVGRRESGASGDSETSPLERNSCEVSGSDRAGFERAWRFVKEVAEGFMPSYLPIAARGRFRVWGDKERRWQLLRRGRYLEFNLLYDRGVKFGLDGGGRVESIMVSGGCSKFPPLLEVVRKNGVG